MSTGRSDGIEQCILDITECPICNDVLRDNRCLPCLHTFCLKCLESYKKKNSKGKSLSCPVCRREYSITKCAADLSRNFFIDKLIDAHKIKEQEILSKNCEICSEDKTIVAATRYCCDCLQNLCVSCERQHKKIKATKMHQIIDNTSVAELQEPAPRPTNCVIHKKKEAELYCYDCETVICWECKSVSHNSHASTKISCASKDLAAMLEGHIEDISEHLKTKQHDFLKLTEQEKLYKDEIDFELKNICRELSKLYRSITDNGDRLKKALSASTSVHLDTFSRLQGKLDSNINTLKKHKVYIEQMIHLGNESDLCEYTVKLISETARMVTENTYNMTVPSVAHLSDLELQDHLIGRRTDTDKLYHTTNSKEPLQSDPHPDNYSKEDTGSKAERLREVNPVQPWHGGTSQGTEKKLQKRGSKKIKVVTAKSISSPKSPTRYKDNTHQSKGVSCAKYGSEDKHDRQASFMDETGTPRQLVVAFDKSESVVDNFSESTEATAVKMLTNSVKNPVEKYNTWSLLRTVYFENGGAVCGITILDSNIYVVFQNSNSVQVYDSVLLISRRSFVVDGLVNPNDVASCSFNMCLYICDWGRAQIFRVKIGDGIKQINWSIVADLGGISVTADHNVLLAGYVSNTLKEYDTKGKLMRSINLEDDFKPSHAIKLVSNDFLICHGNRIGECHRVCLIDVHGKIKTSFGGVQGSEKEQLHGPYHLAVREDGCILVADCNNRRILLLSATLKFVKELIPSSENVLRRARRMHLNEAAGRLYVADNAATGNEIKNGRILMFDTSLL